jgi:hypothetical protein
MQLERDRLTHDKRRKVWDRAFSAKGKFLPIFLHSFDRLLSTSWLREPRSRTRQYAYKPAAGSLRP